MVKITVEQDSREDYYNTIEPEVYVRVVSDPFEIHGYDWMVGDSGYIKYSKLIRLEGMILVSVWGQSPTIGLTSFMLDSGGSTIWEPPELKDTEGIYEHEFVEYIVKAWKRPLDDPNSLPQKIRDMLTVVPVDSNVPEV